MRAILFVGLLSGCFPTSTDSPTPDEDGTSQADTAPFNTTVDGPNVSLRLFAEQAQLGEFGGQTILGAGATNDDNESINLNFSSDELPTVGQPFDLSLDGNTVSIGLVISSSGLVESWATVGSEDEQFGTLTIDALDRDAELISLTFDGALFQRDTDGQPVAEADFEVAFTDVPYGQ